MAITMPDELQTALRLLGLANGTALKIFDVDEDKLDDFADWLVDLCQLVNDSYALVENIFQELADDDTDTAAFKAVAAAVERLGHDVTEITENIGAGISVTMPIIHSLIVAVKTTVIGIISAQAASLIAAIMSGVGIPIALMQKAAMKEIIDWMVEQAKEEFVSYLVNQMTGIIDAALILDDRQERWLQKVTDFATGMAGVQVALQGGSAGQAKVDYDEHDIFQKTTKLIHSMYDFVQGLEQWAGMKEEMTDVGRHRGDRSLWVIAVGELLEWLVDKLKTFGITLVRQTIDGFVELILGTNEVFNQANQKTRDLLTEMMNAIEVYSSKVGMAPLDAPVPGPVMQLITEQSRAMGTAGSDAGRPDAMTVPVGESRPIGTVQESGPHDLSALDLPVTHLKTVGTAHSDASADVPAMDVDVEPV